MVCVGWSSLPCHAGLRTMAGCPLPPAGDGRVHAVYAGSCVHAASPISAWHGCMDQTLRLAPTEAVRAGMPMPVRSLHTHIAVDTDPPRLAGPWVQAQHHRDARARAHTVGLPGGRTQQHGWHGPGWPAGCAVSCTAAKQYQDPYACPQLPCSLCCHGPASQHRPPACAPCTVMVSALHAAPALASLAACARIQRHGL